MQGMKKQQIVVALSDNGIWEGRCMAWSKTGYCKSHPKNLIVFNAQIFSRRGRILREVDLDLTLDSERLTAAARAVGENFYVLYENRPRHDWKPNSGPIIPLLRNAVWWTRIRSENQDVFRLIETTPGRPTRARLNCITGRWQGQPGYSLDVWLNPEWQNLHTTGAVIVLCGHPPRHLRVEERVERINTFTTEPSGTRGRYVRPVFHQRSGLLDFIWFNSGAAVPAVLYHNSVGLLTDVTFTCHAGCAAIHVHRNDQVIGLIWPSSIYAPEVVESARAQLKLVFWKHRAKADSQEGLDDLTKGRVSNKRMDDLIAEGKERLKPAQSIANEREVRPA
jgi:hypothetical protein